MAVDCTDASAVGHPLVDPLRRDESPQQRAQTLFDRRRRLNDWVVAVAVGETMPLERDRPIIARRRVVHSLCHAKRPYRAIVVTKIEPHAIHAQASASRS